MRTRVGFESNKAAKYATSDGRLLEMGDGIVIASFDIRFESRSETDEMPTDVIACDLWVADIDGRIWRTTSRFTTEIFIRHILDVSSTWATCFSLGRAPASFTRAIDSNRVLDDARYSSDDRCFRMLVIDKIIVNTQFYYTTAHMDVGIVPDDNEECPLLVNCAVRFRSNSFLLCSGPEMEQVGAVDEFGFFMHWNYPLLSNTAIYSPEYNRYHDITIPMPLIFTATDESGEPQSLVRITV
jgi:hypothetical protein